MKYVVLKYTGELYGITKSLMEAEKWAREATVSPERPSELYALRATYETVETRRIGIIKAEEGPGRR